MALVIFLLVIALLWLWMNVSALTTRLARLEELLASSKDEIRELTARNQRFEHGLNTLLSPALRPPVPAATEPSAPIVIQPAAVATPASPIVAPPAPPAPAIPRAMTPAAAVPSPAAVPAPPIAVTPPASDQPAVTRTPVEPLRGVVAAATSAAPPARLASPIERPAPAEGADSWEMVVGTSWLNKIGVLVFIVGVALLVGYSFGHVGPLGRVAIGYVLSFAMLGGGVYLERNPAFRNYAYGLVAGGWAGVYFTTFAMHDVPAAKVLESDLAAVALLTVVAIGMIAHSLRYRSQVVTALAFVVAYTTLALSPLSGFSLAASVPLAVSLLLVSQRLGWSGISALGVVATYGAFVVRGAIFPGGAMDPYSAIPYLTLAGYWLTFEAADVIGLRLLSRTAEPQGAQAPAPMLALNAVGFMGAMLVTVPSDNPHLLSALLFGSAAAYVASAVIRAGLLPGWRTRHSRNEPFDSAHGATAIAAALFAVAIGLRFTGNRASLARLLEAQFLVTAGLILGDVWLRRMGSIAMVLAAAYAWIFGVTFGTGSVIFAWAPGTTSAVFGLIAVACYSNREALHRRDSAPEWLEAGYTWIATALLATVLVLELAPAHQALAGLALAALLLEVSFRRSVDYLFQSYVLGGLAAYAMVAAFVIPAGESQFFDRWGAAPTTLDAWMVLPSAIVLTAAAAWRLATRPDDAKIPGRLIATGISAALATAFLAIFEWRVLSPHAIAPAWALTAVGLVALGTWRRQWAWRWQGYALALVATVRAVSPLAGGPPQGTAETVAIALVIAAVYAAAYLGRRALRDAVQPTPSTDDPAEAQMLVLLSLVATASLVVFKWRVLPELMVAPAWAGTGLILVVLGMYRAKPGQRWQGYALAALGSARVIASLLEQPTAGSDATWWAIAAIGITYATTWVARRSATRTNDPAIVVQVLPVVATAALVVLQSRTLEDLAIGPAWVATGVALLALGWWRQAEDFRWQGYALLALGATWAAQHVFGVEETTTAAWMWLAGVIGALYVCGLVVGSAVRARKAQGSTEEAEDIAAAVLLLGATGLLAALIYREVRPSMVTLALGVQGLALMFTGLVARERVLRLSGLALLLACILKLFIYDLRELEALARIMSFVILGLILLAISWTYTRYRVQIRNFL